MIHDTQYIKQNHFDIRFIFTLLKFQTKNFKSSSFVYFYCVIHQKVKLSRYYICIQLEDQFLLTLVSYFMLHPNDTEHKARVT